MIKRSFILPTCKTEYFFQDVPRENLLKGTEYFKVLIPLFYLVIYSYVRSLRLMCLFRRVSPPLPSPIQSSDPIEAKSSEKIKEVMMCRTKIAFDRCGFRTERIKHIFCNRMMVRPSSNLLVELTYLDVYYQ